MGRVTNQMKRMKQKGYSNIDLLVVRETAKKAVEKQLHDAEEKSFLRMLAIPLNVLVSDYWEKTGKRKAPKFIDDVLSLYESVEMGVVTDQQLADFLFEMTGRKIEAEWLKGGSDGK